MRRGPLVVTLLARSWEEFRRWLDAGRAGSADVIEFRLDFVGQELLQDPAPLAELIHLGGRPTIAAIHGSEGFGTFTGSADERVDILCAAARAGITWVDVDARFAGELQASTIDPAAGRIYSTHRELLGLGPTELDAVADELDALRRPGLDLIKIVPEVRSAEEGLQLLTWLETRPPKSTIAFASGAAGSFTRLVAPAFGSVLVYAAPEPVPAAAEAGHGPIGAPGQLAVSHMRAVWGSDPGGRSPGHLAPGPETSIAAVVGRPIGHSASPVTHGAALRALGLDGILVPVAPTSFGAFVSLARSIPRFVGLSVTAPFKVQACELSDERCAASEGLGAVNTLVFEQGRLVAANTDAPAVGSAISAALGRGRLEGLRAVVVGAGGAARAAAFACGDLGAKVTVAARRLEAARALEPHGAVELGSPAYEALRPDIVIHTTPLGTDDVGEAPVPDGFLRPGVAVLDAVYRPAETGLCQRARAAGATVIDGRAWFLGQAWLQHGRLFEAPYRAAGLGDVLASGAHGAQVAMGAALERWLAKPSGGAR